MTSGKINFLLACLGALFFLIPSYELFIEQTGKKGIYRITPFGWICFIVAVLFLIATIVSIKVSNKEKREDMNIADDKRIGDKKEIVSVVKNGDSHIELKVDSSTAKMLSNADENRNKILKAIPKMNAHQKPTIQHQVKQENKEGENNSNTGNNYGNIGGSGNKVTNTFTTPPPRIITDNFLAPFYNKFPDKNIVIRFLVINRAEPELLNVKEQITNLLKKAGYLNVDTGKYSAGVFPEPLPSIEVDQMDGYVQFSISPLK